MRQKGSGVHVPSCPIMHAFTRSPANKQAALENNTAYTLSLPMHIFAKHSRIQAPPLGKKKKGKKEEETERKKKNTLCVRARVHMYVPSPCPLPLHGQFKSFISVIKILALVKNMSWGHVQACRDKNKHVTVSVLLHSALFTRVPLTLQILIT